MVNPIANNPYANKKQPVPPKFDRSHPQEQQPQLQNAVSRIPTTDGLIGIRPLVVAAANAEPLQQLPKAMTFSQAFDSNYDDTEKMEAVGNVSFSSSTILPDSTVASVCGAQQASPNPNNTTITNCYNNDNQQKTITDRDRHAFLLQQPHVLYVSTKQRENPVLEYIRNVPISFSKMVPDYIFNTTSCALFLSIKYHNLYPRYIYSRIAELGKDFTLRVLLVLVDCTDNAAVLLHLNKMAVQRDLTLILAWSPEEAARYLETYKALDGKDASSIQKTKDPTHLADQVHDFLTTCKGVNKTDAASILTQFGTMRSVMAATPDELALVTGIGPVKVKRLYDAFHKPFSQKLARQRRLEREKAAQEEVLLQQEQEILDREEEEEQQCASTDIQKESQADRNK